MTNARAVVVTGVSTGIGWGTTQALVAAGFHVFGSVRRSEDGARAQQAFGDSFTPLLFDVTDGPAVLAAASQVRQALAGQALFGLVNNAGIAVPGPLLHLPLAQFKHQFDVNVTGLLATTQAFAPLLGADKDFTGHPGRIINISSVAGKVATPFTGAYGASKFAVEGLSDALRREMLLFGVDVVLIEPGPIATAIWEKNEQVDYSIYADTAYAKPIAKMMAYVKSVTAHAIPLETVGQLVLRALTIPAPKPRYIITPSLLQHYITRYLPTRMVDKLIARTLGLLPTKS
jgi:NAD(P)-dependent dehydrogenase (short-subunit alcohol dehydrogenase family)